MELKDYIVLVIDDIFEAIKELQNKYCEAEEIETGVISPSLISETNNTCHVDGQDRKVFNINFDVSLSLVEDEHNGKNGSISLKLLSVKGHTDNSSTNALTQKVSFYIPVIYPAIKTLKIKPATSSRRSPSHFIKNPESF